MVIKTLAIAEFIWPETSKADLLANGFWFGLNKLKMPTISCISPMDKPIVDCLKSQN